MNKTNNSSQPLVTVAMVTYNSEKYVRTAIESVLHSSYTNFELIISDDCSTDKTWEIINEYTDARIRKHQNKKNIREYPNRNKCIDLAKGEYLIFVDGDDYIYPHGLAFMLENMLKFPDAAMGLSRPYDSRFIYPLLIEPDTTIYYQYFSKSVLNLSLARNIFKTEILKKEGKLPTKYIAGDYALRLKLAGKYPCLLFNDGLIWWRQRSGQASEKLYISDHGVVESFLIDMEFITSWRITSLNKRKTITTRKKKLIPTLVNRLRLLRIQSVIRIIKLILKKYD